MRPDTHPHSHTGVFLREILANAERAGKPGQYEQPHTEPEDAGDDDSDGEDDDGGDREDE